MWKWLHQIGFYSNVDSNEINIVFCCIVSLTSLFFTQKTHKALAALSYEAKKLKKLLL